jgi:hypothetical protein
MTKGMGMTFKPKPILQFEEFVDQENGRTVIFVKPCGFYNHTFHCMDVVVTPCKHTFHHFCLGVMLRESLLAYAKLDGTQKTKQFLIFVNANSWTML